MDKIVPSLARAMEITMNLSMICIYLNLVKITDYNFIENRKFTSRYNIKIFIVLYIKEDTFACLKGR